MTSPQPFDLGPDSTKAGHLPVQAPEHGLPPTSLFILFAVNLKLFNKFLLLLKSSFLWKKGNTKPLSFYEIFSCEEVALERQMLDFTFN